MWKRQAILTRILQVSSSKSYRSYQVLGTQLLKLGAGQLQKSIFPLKWTTTIISHSFSTQSDSAKALFELGKEKEDFASIKKELSLNPQDEDLHRILIDLLEEDNRLSYLESFYTEIVDMIADPESVSSFYLAGAEALADKKIFPQALSAFRKAMKKDPPMGYKLRYKYGEVLQHEGLYEEALVQFEQVKKGPVPNPDSNEEFRLWAMKCQGPAKNSAAYINYCLGRVQKAKEEFEEIIADRLDIEKTKWDYFLILYHLGDEEVINDYRKRKLEGHISITWGDDLVQFYEQESDITQEILWRIDIDKNTREFNTKKLEGLKVLRKIFKSEEFRLFYMY